MSTLYFNFLYHPQTKVWRGYIAFILSICQSFRLSVFPPSVVMILSKLVLGDGYMDLSEIPETSLMGFIQTFCQTLSLIYGECFYFPLVITCISYLLNRGGGDYPERTVLVLLSIS